MNPGEICIIPFQQADGIIKRRPGLIISLVPPFNDYLVSLITSQTSRAEDKLDELIDSAHIDWAISGLKSPSVIRTAYLTTFPRQRIQGGVGKVSNTTLIKIKNNLKTFLDNN